MKASGVAKYLEQTKETTKETPETVAAFNQTVEEWKKQTEADDLSEEELTDVVGAYSQAIRGKLAQVYNFGHETSQDEADKYAAAMQALTNAYAASLLTEQEKNAAASRLADDCKAQLTEAVGLGSEAFKKATAAPKPCEPAAFNAPDPLSAYATAERLRLYDELKRFEFLDNEQVPARQTKFLEES